MSVYIAGGGGSALHHCSLCLRACLSGTLLAAVNRSLNGPYIDIKCPCWVCSQVTDRAVQPVTQSHPSTRREEQSCSEPGSKGLDVGRQRCRGLECPASPLTWSLTKCHPLQEAFSDHLGPECRETGEAEAQVSPCFHLGWEWTSSRLRGTGLGRRAPF